MGEKNFTGVLQKLLTTNPAHADLFNKLFDTLLQNDLFLKDVVGTLEKENHYSKNLEQVDLLTVEENGIYYVTKAGNSPVGEEGYLEVFNHPVEFENRRTIFWRPHNLSVGGYFNVLTDGVWLGWQQNVSFSELEKRLSVKIADVTQNPETYEEGYSYIIEGAVSEENGHPCTSGWKHITYLVCGKTYEEDGKGYKNIIGIDNDGVIYNKSQLWNTEQWSDWTRMASTKNLCNPNWIINSYFKNPINQRGVQTGDSIGSGTYGLDHWRAYAHDGRYAIYFKEEHVEIDCMGTYGAMEQVIENSEYLSGKTVTLSIEVVNVKTEHGYIQLLNNVFEYHLELPKKDGIYFLTVTLPHLTKEDPLRVIVGCNLDLLVTNDIVGLGFKWIKLELGNVATMYIPPNPAEELPKCQRYYREIKGVFSVMQYTSLDLKIYIGDYINNMRISNPILKFKTNHAYSPCIREKNCGSFIDGFSFTVRKDCFDFFREGVCVQATKSTHGFTDNVYLEIDARNPLIIDAEIK